MANFSNSKRSNSHVPSLFPPAKWLWRDIGRCDRLWVACAGNTYGMQVRFPAALDLILGVSGLYGVSDGGAWYPYLGEIGTPLDGSTWYPDQWQPPCDRLYQVSGIYGFRESDDPTESAYLAWVPATPVDDLIATHYHPFYGTSFATPQVAGLAALLFDERPEARYWQVKDHIIGTRNQDIEYDMFHQYSIPLAGLVDYDEALDGWNE